MENFIIALFGLAIGSFLNVCIFRIPKGESIIYPFSYCRNCGKKIPWHDNIPLLSYILLKGRCRFCKARISLQYPLVETITPLGLIFLYHHFNFLQFIFYSILFFFLIIITFVDLRCKIIPDSITLSGIIIGLIFNFLNKNFLPALYGAVLGGGILFLIAVISKGGMGGGDVKFLAMLGAFFGWRKVLFILFLASLFGSLVGGYLILFKKKSRKTAIAFGPFLSLAAFIILIYGDKLIEIWKSFLYEIPT